MNGTVKWFNAKKGYGFIIGKDGNEYFVHYSKIVSDKKYKALKNGNDVTFDIETSEDKTMAINVKALPNTNVKEINEDED